MALTPRVNRWRNIALSVTARVTSPIADGPRSFDNVFLFTK
jgi:hypothetical protein